MRKTRIILSLLVFMLTIGIVSFGINAIDTYVTNKKEFALQKIDDETNYETIKQVEDKARAMISSYASDKLTYIQYKDSEDKEEKSWSNQAKMRANKTASTYNNYLLENSFIWKNNMPDDINTELPIIE